MALFFTVLGCGEKVDPDLDSDGDGLTDVEEEALGTDPMSTDSDGDEFSDSEEVASGTDPTDFLIIPIMVDGPKGIVPMISLRMAATKWAQSQRISDYLTNSEMPKRCVCTISATKRCCWSPRPLVEVAAPMRHQSWKLCIRNTRTVALSS